MKEEAIEIFARTFAMPRDRFIKIVGECTKNGKCDISKVAEKFGVLYSEAYIRGKELGLWDM